MVDAKLWPSGKSSQPTGSSGVLLQHVQETKKQYCHDRANMAASSVSIVGTSDREITKHRAKPRRDDQLSL